MTALILRRTPDRHDKSHATKPADLVSTKSQERVPASRDSQRSLIVLAEREVEALSREIAATDAHGGLLRRQRENLLDWIFRQAVWREPGTPSPVRGPATRRRGRR